MKKIHHAAWTGLAEPVDGQLPKIANVRPTVRLAAREVLFHKGDTAFGIFRLISGQIRLVRVTPEFAEEIGLSHEALYRALATLKKQGCIERDNDQIRLVAKRLKTLGGR